MKAVQMNYDRIHDSTLINELASLNVKNGRIDHSTAGHDDTVIAYLLACYFVYFGKNFNLYDIDHSTFLNKVSSSGKIVEPDYKQQQDELAERIKDIKRMLSTTTNRIVVDSLTRELRNLETQIDTEIVDVQPTTVEQMRTNAFKDYVYDPNNLSHFLSLNLN